MPGRVIALALVAVLAAAFVAVVGIAQLTDSGSASNETDESVAIVLDDIDKVAGKRISVEGDIKTFLRPNAFLLGSSDATQRGLLVVPKEGVAGDLGTNEHVHVLGTAQPFDLAAFGQAHPDAAKTPAIRGLEGQPAIVEATVSRGP